MTEWEVNGGTIHRVGSFDHRVATDAEKWFSGECERLQQELVELREVVAATYPHLLYIRRYQTG